MRASPALLLTPLLLAGCLADYTLPSDVPTARVKVVDKATPMICVAGRPTRLVPGRDGYARVPAGRPITLAAQFEGHDFVCMPALSVSLEAEASYEQSFRVVSRSCTTALHELTPAGQVAVAGSAADSFGCRGRP
jgi:hypothetical protein